MPGKDGGEGQGKRGLRPEKEQKNRREDEDARGRGGKGKFCAGEKTAAGRVKRPEWKLRPFGMVVKKWVGMLVFDKRAKKKARGAQKERGGKKKLTICVLGRKNDDGDTTIWSSQSGKTKGERGITIERERYEGC